MDTITHILLGYSFAQSEIISKSREAQAVIILASIFPDIDLVWRIKGLDKYFIHHRRESHCFFGLLVQSFVLLGLARLLSQINIWLLWLLIWIGLLGHIMLDFFTSYGVPVFYPFTKRFFSFALLFIFDPWLDILLGVSLLGLIFKEHRLLLARLAFCSAFGYLVFLVLMKRLVLMRAKKIFNAQDKKLKIRLFPYFANPLRWLVLAKKEDVIYRTSLSLFKGEEIVSEFRDQISKELRLKLRENELIQSLTNFSDFLFWKCASQSTKKIVRVYDLRYSQYNLGFCAQLELDENDKVISQRFSYY